MLRWPNDSLILIIMKLALKGYHNDNLYKCSDGLIKIKIIKINVIIFWYFIP